MYAIVEIAGTQVKVEKDKYYYTPLLEGNDGDKVEFENVLLMESGDKITVGSPSIKGSKVTGKILGHLQGDKVIVFKKKRRKGYRKKNGHRQNFTKVLIDDILLDTSKGGTSAKNESASTKSTKKETKDDLTQIKGIGPVFQEELSKLGYTTFDHISKLTSKDIETIAEKIDGISIDLVASEEWIEQAKATDLTQITGIGPVFKEELHKLGYYNLGQIANLTAEEIETIAEKIDGISIELVASEEWIKQAKKLIK